MQLYIEYEFGWFCRNASYLNFVILKKMIATNICRSTCLERISFLSNGKNKKW